MIEHAITSGAVERRKRGRPRRVQPRSALSVRLDPALHDRLSKKALEDRRSVTELVLRGIALVLREPLGPASVAIVPSHHFDPGGS